MENTSLGLEVRSHLLEIDDELLSPSHLISCFLPGQHSFEALQNEADLSERTNVRSISGALANLQDLVEPIRLVLATARSTGPYEVLKSRIDGISAEHLRSSSHDSDIIQDDKGAQDNIFMDEGNYDKDSSTMNLEGLRTL